MLSTLTSDLRYAARTLGRNPGFAAAAIATIVLGIGVNAGIFTTVNGLLYRNLPAPDAHDARRGIAACIGASRAYDGACPRYEL